MGLISIDLDAQGVGNGKKGSTEMTRNLRALGLTLLAVLALCAVTASGASGDVFTAAKNPIITTGAQESHSGLLDLFSTTAGETECEEITYAATMTETPTTSIKVTPKYGGCFVAEVIPVKVDINSCVYTTTINPVAGKTEGWVDVECSKAEEEIAITVGAPGTVKCTLHLPQQTVGGITYSNIAGGKVTNRIIATGIKYSETAGSGLGSCTTSTLQSNGTYNGAAIVEGFEDLSGVEGKSVAISVS